MNNQIFRYAIPLLTLPNLAWAEGTPRQYDLVSQLIFWLGAFAVMYLMAKQVFKEQFHERKTQRRLTGEIGPFYPEFDIDALKRWVHRCAPHVWRIYRTNDLSLLDGFITEGFRNEYQHGGPKTVGTKGEKLVFDQVLKVHTLGIYMVSDGQPPEGIELMLRLEEKVKRIETVVTNPDKPPRFTQVQTFWTLRHEEGKWKLERVWEATEDMNDLAQRAVVPDVRNWLPK